MKKCEITLTHGQAILTWPDNLTDDDIDYMIAVLQLQLKQIGRGRKPDAEQMAYEKALRYQGLKGLKPD